MMFEHLLITRFNLKNPDWDLTKNKENLLDDSWMNERIELFKNYCFPSVINQSNNNFKWLLYFDSSTGEKFKIQIETLVKDHENIQIFYINGMPEFNNSILSYIKSHASSKPYLITSRIDNDDSISKYFIEEVQKQFNKQEFLAIDFIEGYTLQVEPEVILGKKEHIFNPFISLIEKNQDPKTVWHYSHTQWKKEPRILQISGKRIWMSVIHQKNKVNEFDGYGNINWNSINKEFILSEAINTKITQNIIPFKNWWFRSLRNYLYVNMVLFSKKFKKAIGVYKVK